MTLLSPFQIGTTTSRRVVQQSRKSKGFFRNPDADDLCSSFNSTLINGKGRYFGGPQDVPLSVVSVKRGTAWVLILFLSRGGLDLPRRIRYRFLLISMSCQPRFLFSIDDHQFTVIEVEGTNVQPLVVDSIEILAGMRNSNNSCSFINRFLDRSTLFRCCQSIFLSTRLKVLLTRI
jgi:hypothetical protein